MPSGKHSRQVRHTHEAAVHLPSTGRRSASPRVLLAGAAAVAVVLAAAVGIMSAVSGGGSAKPLAAAAEVRLLLDGVTQHGNVLGAPAAPVTLVEYADLQCPYCRDFDRQAVPGLISQYIRSGKVKLVFRPLAFIGPDSGRGRDAIIAAGLQNRFFEFVQLFYANQGAENGGWLGDSMVRSAAKSVPGLDLARFDADRSSTQVAQSAKAFDSEAARAGIRSTPTLLVGRTGKTLHKIDPGQLDAAVSGLLP